MPSSQEQRKKCSLTQSYFFFFFSSWNFSFKGDSLTEVCKYNFSNILEKIFLSSRREEKAGDEHTVEVTFGIAHQLSNGMSQWHRPLINLNPSSIIRSASLCSSAFFGWIWWGHIESEHHRGRNSCDITSWCKLEPHWGKETRSRTPPETGLGKLKGEGKVRGTHPALCYPGVKKQPRLKQTKSETHGGHFQPSNSSQTVFL